MSRTKNKLMKKKPYSFFDALLRTSVLYANKKCRVDLAGLIFVQIGA